MTIAHDPFENQRVSITAPYARSAGQGVLKGNLFGVALHDAANNAALEIVTTGTFTLAKKSADTPAIGAVVYWDNTNKELTTTSSSNYAVGVVVNAAGVSGETTVDCRLNGTHTVAS